MRILIECVREILSREARTFMLKIKSHRGTTQQTCKHSTNGLTPKIARKLPEEYRQRAYRTNRMIYEWHNKGVTRTSACSRAVRNAMRKGGAEFQRQKVLTKAAGNLSKEFLRTTDAGRAQVQQTACTGVKCNLMDKKRLGWECMLQLQEVKDRKTQQPQREWGAQGMATLESTGEELMGPG